MFQLKDPGKVVVSEFFHLFSKHFDVCPWHDANQWIILCKIPTSDDKINKKICEFFNTDSEVDGDCTNEPLSLLYMWDMFLLPANVNSLNLPTKIEVPIRSSNMS